MECVVLTAVCRVKRRVDRDRCGGGSGRFGSVVRKSSFDHPGIRASGHSVIRASGLSASGVVEVFLGVRSSVKRVGACSREKGRGQQNPFQ